MSKKKNKNNKKNNKKKVEDQKEELKEITSNDLDKDAVNESVDDPEPQNSNEIEGNTNDKSLEEEDFEEEEEDGDAAGAGAIPPTIPPAKGKGGIAGFWEDRSPVLRFVILFALFMGIFYSIWATQWFHDVIVKNVTTFDSKIASMFLNIFGYETTAVGTSVVSERITVNVKTGCDGIEAMALFVSGVTAYTAPKGYKIKGIIAGVSFLFFMNLVRIVHLWLCGFYLPEYFEFFHQNFWQIVFILISIITWALWINRINKNKKAKKVAND